MKYIPVLNEEWYEGLLEDYDTAFQEVFRKLAHFNKNIIPSQVYIDPTPVEIDGHIYPFPLAVELEKMYSWMMGEQPQPDNLAYVMEDILRLVWFNPFVDYSEIRTISWDAWIGLASSYTGQFYRFAQISLKLENEESLNATDLALISGLSVSAISKKIKEKKIVAKKEKSEWVVEASEAKKWIEEQNSKMANS